MRRGAALWLAAAALGCGAACANIWGFQSVTEAEDGGVDATTPEAAVTGEGGGEAGGTEASVDAGGEAGGPDAHPEAGACPGTERLCNGTCADTTSTATSCGGCADAGGKVCPGEPDSGQPACVNSACTLSCNTGFTLCGYNPDGGGGGTCVSLNTTSNCGACGVQCVNDAGGPVACIPGDGSGQLVCGTTCPPSQTLCGGACVDTKSDVDNCGVCGNACTTTVGNAHPTCSSTGCGFACNAGFTACNNGTSCVDETSDKNNCGGCGTVCSGGTPLCVGGMCKAGCVAPTPDSCGGTCTSKQTDPNNCGSCSFICTDSVANSTPACVSGGCTIKCNAGYTPCNGTCVNEQSDRNNCGGCGSSHACTSGLSCSAGACACVASACPSCALLSSPCCKSSTACGCTGPLGIGCN